MAGTGCLILVVGPSGAGKDTLLDQARRHFRNNPAVVFPQRLITRPADAGGEDHRPVSEAAFGQMLAEGGLAFHWDAHGLRYGIPRTIDDDLAHGRAVVVNVSRTVCEPLTRRYPKVRVLSVAVNPAALSERLRGRGRESEAEIEGRLARAGQYRVEGANVTPIDNSGRIEEASAAFIQAIRDALPAA